MKKRLLLIVLLAAALAILIPASVLAQSPGGLAYTSGVQVINLDAGTANIGLTYYNQDGTVAATATDTIAGNDSNTYFPIHAPVGFNGSLVVSSDKPVTAIANTVTTDLKYGAATTSFSAGATTVNLPLIMCNNSGLDTWFNVQNAGTSDANITINYTPAGIGNSGSETDTIKPGAAHTFDQASGSSTENCDSLGSGGNSTFVGSAVITSDQPVVATVMQLATSPSLLLGYNGFSTSSDNVVLPLIMANNSGFYTGFQVQNAGDAATNVTVDYSPNNVANGFEPVSETFSLNPGESWTVINNSTMAGGNNSDNDWLQKYVGSATATTSNGEELVIIVNQIFGGGGGVGPYATSYEGFDTTAATSDVTAALIMANNSGFYTGVQIMNVGGSTCASITMDYGPNAGGAFNPADEVITNLGAGSSYTVIQNGAAGPNGSVNDWTGNKYVGSAEISAPGCEIVAIVNEVFPIKGDGFYTYNGFNH